MESPERISEQAVALAAESDRDAAIKELIRLADQEPAPLETARQILVRRLALDSNDFAATAGLTLINVALSKVGWPDPMAWKPRAWRVPRAHGIK